MIALHANHARWRRKGKFQVLVKRPTKEHPLGLDRPSPTLAIPVSRLGSSNRITPCLETRPRHLISPHRPPNTYNNHHRGLTTLPAPSRAPRNNLLLRHPQLTHTNFPPINLPKTKHGSPTAPLPPPHQALLTIKTLRLDQQIPTQKPKTRPQPISPIDRRRHDPTNLIGTIEPNQTSAFTIALAITLTATTTIPPSTLSLVPLRRRTLQIRRRAALITQSNRDHHRAAPGHALAAAARNVPLTPGVDPARAPMSEAVGGARRRGERAESGEGFEEFA